MNKTTGIKTLFIALLLVFALSLAPQMSFAYKPEAVQLYNDAIDMSKNGNFTGALDLFKKSIAIDPTFTDSYYNIASIYEYLGNKVQALNYFEITYSKNPGDSEVGYKIASTYYKKKSYTKALKYLQNIKQDDPRYSDAVSLKKKITLEINKIKQMQAAKAAAEKVAATKATAQTTTPIKTSEPVKALPPVASGNYDITKEDSYSQTVYKDFQGPTGITRDQKGNLYIANYGSNSIVQITPDGKRTVILKGDPLNGPIGLACDSFNNLYIANYVSNEIVKMTPDGKCTIILKGVNKPYYLYIDKSGMLYVSEQGTNTVLKVKVI